MWLFRWILTIFFILIVLLFAIQNQDQEVSVRFLNHETSGLPLYLILYIAFAAGILFWFLFSTLYVLKIKGQMRKFQKENQKIKQELNRLRNANIEEELEPTESIEGE
jgi:uncharacterized integral membrane protein